MPVLAALLSFTMAQTVEFRSYNLRPGTRQEFHRLVLETLPLLRRHDIDVVAFGPSQHDTTSYFLVRAFASPEDRQHKEDAFYSSREWREGPRERVLALIESYTTVVLPASNAACPVPAAADARAAVERLNEQYITAASSGDHGWFNAHLADDFVAVLGVGRRLTKADFVALVRAGPNTTRSLGPRNVTIRAFGTTVQADADAPWERQDGGRVVSRYIDTYAWLDCRWQVISAQITPLPAAP